MRSTFEERVFQKNRFSENVTFFCCCCWRVFGVFPKIFLYLCNHFGLEPIREMMLGCEFSFLSNQINYFVLINYFYKELPNIGF